MPESFEVSETIPASPVEIYAAFLDSRKHSAMTDSKASVDPAIGGKFTAWDEYISGTTLALETNCRIKQNWRTTDFPADAPDSLLEILLEKAPGGTKVTFKHMNIPDGQAESYKDGWTEFYFEPMKAYFAKKRPPEKKTTKAKY